MTAEKFDVYTHVTIQIIVQIEAGTPPWRKPWTGGGVSVGLPERFNGKAYRAAPIVTRLKQHGISASGAEPFATTVALPQALRLAFGGVPKDELKGIFQKVREAVERASET